MWTLRRLAPALLVATTLGGCVTSVQAQGPLPANGRAEAGSPYAPTYADLADLADSAPLVVHARVRKFARVDDSRAPGLRPGHSRFYVEADTRSLITGRTPIGERFAYLVDVPVNAQGKPPFRKKDGVLIFARTVPGRPGELQLVRPGAQIPWTQASESQVREIVRALLEPDAPGKVTGVREIIHVPGTLAGEGETQIFLTTADSSAASVTVRHTPGAPPQWGASFSELVAEVGRPPKPQSLEWYRLACFLPQNPPPGVNLSESLEARRRADADYRLVMSELGPCDRSM
ncbi:hypothetical protein [Novosphingobium sp. M1R2S20]|uniref:Lipoprotein n=1 Tax=Novosphingobium rhizovicinum TaxID=3228928 RepID=A0ABV3R9P3_9SPHN